MGLTAAAARGVVVFLLSMPVVQSQYDWGVTFTSTQICAPKGSTVELHSTYRHSSRANVEKTLWFTKLSYETPVDLREDPEYAGRVQNSCYEKSCTLTITDLRESDSAKYKFRFMTNQPRRWYTSWNGVTLEVTGLQVSPPAYWNSAWITCDNRCVPDSASYIWYRNGQEIQESQKYFYSNNLDPADSYTCALKGHEDFHSPSVCVRGQSCNRVTYTHRSICAFKGSSVDISSTYSSYETITSKLWFSPERSHQWVYQSRPEDLRKDPQYAGRVQVLETEGGRSTLRITELTERDSAQYHFKFTAGSFDWRSSLPGTTLTVTALQVQVTTTTHHQLYTEAELKCNSSCSPAGRLSFVWFKNGQRIMREETSSYKDNFDPGDKISCAFKGREDYRSPSVYGPRLPSVSVSPSAEIVEGSSVNLTCSSEANPAATYTWYKEDQKHVSTEPQLVLTSVQSSDSGEYYCTAENDLGTRTSERIPVKVKYPPRTPSVSVSPSGEIVEGSSVTLTCSSDANPAATYTWYKEDQTLFQAPEGSYSFTSIRSEDSGIYYCKSENKLGQLGSKPVLLDVQYGPRLPSVSVSPSAEIVEGSSVNLTCSSDANPAATYTWYKEDEDSPTASGQIFSITDFRAEHSGNYYCEAWNKIGHHNNTLHLALADTWTLAAAGTTAGTTTAVVLAVILFFVFMLVRKKRASKPSCEPGQRADSREQYHLTSQRQPEEQDDLYYASVQFSKNKPDCIYSNCRPAEEEAVEYTVVRFDKSSTAPRSQESAEEDSTALYSTINKTC